MKRKRIFRTVLTSLTSLAATTTAWSQVSVSVNNPSFEDDVLTNGTYADTGPSGWTGGYNYVGQTTWFDDEDYDGVFNPGLGGDYDGDLPSGNGSNAAWAQGYAGYNLGTRQILTDKLLPSLTYDLSVDVGNPDVTVGGAGYRVALFAGLNEVAFVSGAATSAGTWTTTTLSYTAPADGDPLIGEVLEIRLLTADGPTGNRVHYDDLSFERDELIVPVADAGGNYVITGSSDLALDGTNSTAPDTSTITVYEWDLDDNGTYDVTGSSPVIPNLDLTTTYGMVFGDNEVTLRVTAANTFSDTATTNVSITPSTPISVPIANHSFEDPVLAEGGHPATDPTSWIGGYYDGGDISASTWQVETGSYRGHYNPNVVGGDYNGGADVPDGQQVAYCDYYAGYYMGFSQVLSDTLLPDLVYSLSVEVGNPDLINGGGSIADYRVELLAGGTKVAETTGSSPASGDFSTVTVPFYQAPSFGDPLLSEPLEIRIMVISSGTGTELHFDEVKLLRGTLAGPVAKPGGPYTVSASGGLLSLDGSDSVPPDGGAITLYEWDLDDNGSWDVTGATPTPITSAALISTWGMTLGGNAIAFRVTDGGAMTSATTASVFLAPETTFIGPNKTNGDNWNVPGNWDIAIPAGGLDVNIPAGKQAHADGGTAVAYTGDLTMGDNSQLSIGWTNSNGRHAADANCLGTPGSTTVNTGNNVTIVARLGTGSGTFPALALGGDLLFVASTSTEPVVDWDFAHGISGTGVLTIQGKGNKDVDFSAPGSFTEIIFKNTEGSFDSDITAANALNGDVTIESRDGTNPDVDLSINVDDAIGDSAALALNGASTATLITMNANDTVDTLSVNGFDFPAGTYGSLATTADNPSGWIGGTGILTVTNGPVDGTPPGVPVITDNSVNGEIFFSEQSLTYTLVFDEPVTTSSSPADFELTGSASATVDSVTQTNFDEVQVVVTATSVGTVTLGAKASASFDDLSGNTLNGPFTDPDTITVLDIAGIENQLGILDLTANNGVNPATGLLWKDGDNYRLIFASSTGIDATSSDIAVYNSHVSTLATSAGYGAVTWKAFASTPTVDARDNTLTASGTGESFWLMNGTTKIADDYADFYDGHTNAEAIQISETGGTPLDNGNFTSLWTGTAPDGTGQANDELGAADGTSIVGLWGTAASAAQWITRFGGQYQDSAGNSGDGEYALYGMSEVLTVSAVGGGSVFDTWATSQGLTEGNNGQGDDADGGSLNNLGEFGLGGDPLNANDDGSLLHAFSGEVVGGGPEEGILTILVRNGASFTSAGDPAVSDAAVDGITYTVAADTTPDVDGGGLTVTPTGAVTTGLPAAPAGYTYASFYISGTEGYFQVTVAPE